MLQRVCSRGEPLVPYCCLTSLPVLEIRKESRDPARRVRSSTGAFPLIDRLPKFGVRLALDRIDELPQDRFKDSQPPTQIESEQHPGSLQNATPVGGCPLKTDSRNAT